MRFKSFNRGLSIFLSLILVFVLLPAFSLPVQAAGEQFQLEVTVEAGGTSFPSHKEVSSK